MVVENPGLLRTRGREGDRQARGNAEEGGRTGAASEGKRRRGRESGGGRRGRGREAMAGGGGEAVYVEKNLAAGSATKTFFFWGHVKHPRP